MTVLSVPALASTATAQASDPVTALKQQFRPHRGVKVSETVHSFLSGLEGTARRTGELQFGPTGLIARDTNRHTTIKLDAKNPPSPGLKRRSIAIAGLLYTFDDSLPKGKKWIRQKEEPQDLGAAFGDDTFNVFEPTTLKALLRGSAGKPSGGFVRYRGSLTYAELHGISKAFRVMVSPRPTGEFGRTKIDWQLWIDRRGLVNRVTTNIKYIDRDYTVTSDTRYTAWGSRVTIEKPPAGQIIDQKDVKRVIAEEQEKYASIPLNP
jgi:hypothetical protein